MKALITGLAGFVGRHMAAELLGRGWDVTGIDIRRGGRETAFLDAMDLFNWNQPSFPPIEQVYLEIQRTEYDLLVHCAYEVGGRAGIEGNHLALGYNLTLDAAMFRWAVIAGRVDRILYLSSSAAYPVVVQNEANHPLYEDLVSLDYPCPDADYGWAKLTGERLVAAARNAGQSVTVVRPFSGYGADQSLDYPFPAIMKRVREWKPGEPLRVIGDPTSTRDWIHISDVVKGALAVVDGQNVSGVFRDGHRLKAAEEPVNLCTGVATSFASLIGTAWTALHPDEEVPAIKSMAGPTGVKHRVGDPTRMRQYYTPKISVLEGIREALDA